MCAWLLLDTGDVSVLFSRQMLQFMRLQGFSGNMAEWEDIYATLCEDFERDVSRVAVGAFGHSAFVKYVGMAELSDDFLWDAARLLAQENSGTDFA
jgi:hypothetical protein